LNSGPLIGQEFVQQGQKEVSWAEEALSELEAVYMQIEQSIVARKRTRMEELGVDLRVNRAGRHVCTNLCWSIQAQKLWRYGTECTYIVKMPVIQEFKNILACI
jgi:hypothetical protein